ncbi:MAG: hypothetical protein LBH47_00560 [Christensenellaceae bacterium]|jgi:ribosomal protein S18 acetylase RimI-like enzyme|nr:hypothetical protein [Christensenellaceae bacterium]
MGIYYVGYKASDIENDNFFQGSITLYEASDVFTANDDIFFESEKSNKRKKYISKKCKEIIKKDANAEFLPASLFIANLIPTEYQEKIVCVNSPIFIEYLSSKFHFKELLSRNNLPQSNYIIEKGSCILQKIQENYYPNKKEVVIQNEYGEGGFGVQILTREKKIKDPQAVIEKNQYYIVSDYKNVKLRFSLPILICDNAIGRYPASIERLNGLNTATNDIEGFDRLSAKIKDKCKKISVQLGEAIRGITTLRNNKRIKLRNRGFFEINAILTNKNEILVTEVLPMFTGTTKVLNQLYLLSNVYGIYEQCYKCFKGEPIDLDNFQNIRKLVKKEYKKIVSINTYDDRNIERTYMVQKNKDKLLVRKARPDDIDEIMRIYRAAKQFMVNTGNPNQWTGDWPYKEIVLEDIQKRELHKVLFNGNIVGCFGLEEKLTHAEIHRIAADGTVKGIAKFVLDFVFNRVDKVLAETSFDNKIMQHIFTKYGFKTTGTAKYTYPDQNGKPITKGYYCYEKENG